MPYNSNACHVGLLLQADCLPCSGGHYCEGNANPVPTGPCVAGWYCTSAAESADDPVNGGECPLGNYCPEGSTGKRGIVGSGYLSRVLTYDELPWLRVTIFVYNFHSNDLFILCINVILISCIFCCDSNLTLVSFS